MSGFINSPVQFGGSGDNLAFATFSGRTEILAVPSLRTVKVFRQTTFSGATNINAVGLVRDIFISRFASFSGATNIRAYGVSRNEGAVVFSGATNIRAIGSRKLALTTPSPILNEIAENAFGANKSHVLRVKNGATELDIKSININASVGGIGKTINLELAKKDINIADKSGVYKVEIGTKTSLYATPSYHTILENAQLNSRNYQNQWLNDNLSFGVDAPLSERLNKVPTSNLIVYDPTKLTVSIDEIERIPDQAGNYIATNLRPISVLSLYQLLNIAFVEGCGFSSFETDIPNYEIARCDFTILNSWHDTIKGFIGQYQPIIYTVGNVVYIKSKVLGIPEDFEPRTVTPNSFIKWQREINNQPKIDGFILQYVESNINADIITNRTVSRSVDVIPFSSPNYTHIDTVQTWKDYANSAKPDVILRSELYSEVKETVKGASTVIGRDTDIFVYDSQGRRVETRKTSQKLVPDLSNAGILTLLTIREEIQEFFYKTDRFNPKRMIQDRVVTNISGLIAVDSENQYFESDFKQDFSEANKAGNLKEGMTTETGAIKTVIETFFQLGNGQIEVETETIDHVRNVSNSPTSDIRQADASFSGVGGKQKPLIIWKTGQSRDSRDGNPLETFNVGELPLVFAEPLAELSLVRRDAQFEQGILEFVGYDSSIERGVYLGVVDGNGDLVGVFIIEGYSINGTTENAGDGMFFRTRLEVTQIR